MTQPPKEPETSNTNEKENTDGHGLIFTDDKRLDPGERARYLLVPLVITIAVLGLIVVFKGWTWTGQLIVCAGTQFVLAGKFIVFAGLDPSLSERGFTVLVFAMLVVYMDVLVGSVVMINIAVFYKIPLLGNKLDQIQANSEEMLEANPWARKATFIALMAFVAFPLTGTGAIGGGFFGRMLGLKRKTTFLGLLCGSILGTAGIYGLSLIFGNVLEYLECPWAKAGLIIGGIVVIAAFIYVLSRRVKKGFGNNNNSKPDAPTTNQQQQ